MLNEHETEELLRRSNPEPDAQALRMEPHVVQASATSIVEGREAMSTSLSQPKPIRRPQWSRALAIAAVSAAVVLVAIGGITLLSRTGGDEVAPIALPGTASLLEGTWERTVIDELEPYAHFEDIEATSFGLVAAAVMDGVWISKDGTGWHQALVVPNEPAPPVSPNTTTETTVPPPAGLVETYVRHVAEFDGALYAIANMASGINTPEMESQLVVWRSEDAVQWNEVTLESVDGCCAAPAGPAIATEGALLLYTGNGEVYRTEDGTTWERFDANVPGLSYTQFGDEFVAIGEVPAGETVASHAYTSPDGVTWTQVPDSEFPIGHHPYGPLVEFNGALYVGGMTFSVEEDGAGAVWRSEDGRSWTKVDLGVGAGSMYEVADLIVTPHGMLVVGLAPGESGNHQDTVVLATDDGVMYEPVPDPDAIFSDAVYTSGAFFDGRVVMTGHEPYSDASIGLAYQWVWTP